MTERDLIHAIREALASLGYRTIKLHGGPYMEPGLPDLLAVKDGRVWFFEVKLPGNKPTRIQEYVMADLRAHGAAAVCVRSVAEVVIETLPDRGGHDVAAIMADRRWPFEWVLQCNSATEFSVVQLNRDGDHDVISEGSSPMVVCRKAWSAIVGACIDAALAEIDDELREDV